MLQPKERLTEITSVIFESKSSYGDLLNACQAYKELLLEASQLSVTNDGIDDTIMTASGKAIGPSMAVLCVDDFMRTVKFCRGIRKAVDHKKKNKNGRIELLYGGTGPFATLVLPLITRFSANELGLTLLEINEKSFKAMMQTFHFFQAEDFIVSAELTDATTYTPLPTRRFDIVVIEAMTHALKSEHQVAIAYNLFNHMEEDSIMIPQNIRLNLLALNTNKQDIYKQSLDSEVQYFESLGTLFSLNKQSIREHHKAFFAAFPDFIFPDVETSIPEHIDTEFDELSIETSIQVYDDIVLEMGESGLTTLLKLFQVDPMHELAPTLRTRYICGKYPRLQCRLIS